MQRKLSQLVQILIEDHRKQSIFHYYLRPSLEIRLRFIIISCLWSQRSEQIEVRIQNSHVKCTLHPAESKYLHFRDSRFTSTRTKRNERYIQVAYLLVFQ